MFRFVLWLNIRVSPKLGSLYKCRKLRIQHVKFFNYLDQTVWFLWLWLEQPGALSHVDLEGTLDTLLEMKKLKLKNDIGTLVTSPTTPWVTCTGLRIINHWFLGYSDFIFKMLAQWWYPSMLKKKKTIWNQLLILLSSVNIMSSATKSLGPRVR